MRAARLLVRPPVLRRRVPFPERANLRRPGQGRRGSTARSARLSQSPRQRRQSLCTGIGAWWTV
eukprot:2385447-Alexandrium_andersonii.AAC.1